MNRERVGGEIWQEGRKKIKEIVLNNTSFMNKVYFNIILFEFIGLEWIL